METDLRRWLSSEFCKSALDAINTDPDIGPSAPGDGDVVQWYALLCWLAVRDLKEQLLAGKLRPVSDFELHTNYKFPKANIPNALADMGEAIFCKAFPEPEPPPRLAENVLLYHSSIMMEFIHQWGGRSVRVHKRRKVRAARERVREVLSEGVAIKDIPGLIGISRATVYRILEQKN